MMVEYELKQCDEENIIAGFAAITFWCLILGWVFGYFEIRNAVIFISFVGLWSWLILMCSIGYLFYRFENNQPPAKSLRAQQEQP